MLIKVEGIVVSEMSYKESSKIINIFTPSHGIFSVIAKGAKNIKSKYHISKLTYALFDINYNINGLSTLIDVSPKNNFLVLKKDILKISYATFITDLVTQVYKHDNSNNIYDLYKASLIKINEGLDPLVITNILELKLLDNLGIKPIIDSCVNCGSKENIVTISSYKGGYICNNCFDNNEKVVDNKTIKLIRMFYYVDISKINKLDISKKIKEEINHFIDDYYDSYSGLYLKSKYFLKNIEKL